ncbi:malectin [Tachysurus ichikawai]
MRRVTAPGVIRFVVAVVSMLADLYRAEGDVVNLSERVIWAVNAGGEAHTDTHGVHYKKDPLEGKLGKGEKILQDHTASLHTSWLFV